MFNSTINRVATLIENDLRRRGLAAGDMYLTADEVGRVLSVHPRAAGRAMGLLAKRGILMRKRGAGTFVGPNGHSTSDVQIHCIHLLCGYALDHRHIGIPAVELVDALQESTGCNSVQWNLLPPGKQVEYVRELLNRGKADGYFSGCMLTGCVREVQEAVLASGVPAVVFGGVHATTSRLPSADLDQAMMGYLLAKHLLRRKPLRLAMVMRELWLPGDQMFHDGICRALSEAKYDDGGVAIRAVPLLGLKLAVDMVVQLLRQENPPTSLICRDLMLAEAALQAAAIVGLRVPDDLEIVFDHWAEHSGLGLPHAYPAMTYKEQAKLVGEMLRSLIEGKRPDPEHVVIPVQLAEQGCCDAEGAVMRVDEVQSQVTAPAGDSLGNALTERLRSGRRRIESSVNP